jgi:hypothetical protein
MGLISGSHKTIGRWFDVLRMTIALARFDVTQRKSELLSRGEILRPVSRILSECTVNSALLLVRPRYLAWEVWFPVHNPAGRFLPILTAIAIFRAGCGRSAAQKTSSGRHGSLAALCMEVTCS